MFRNYLSAALRNLLRNRLVSIINIGGLALGFAAAILIALYLRYQLSYEQFLPGHDQVYRLSLTIEWPGRELEVHDDADFLMAERLKLNYPEVEMSARMVGLFGSVRRGELEFHENVMLADRDFFRMIPFPTIRGDLTTALDAPDGLVITHGIARKYFGSDDVVGQTLEFNRHFRLRVLAVIEDLPGNTHFGFRMVASSGAQFSEMRDLGDPSQGLNTFRPGAHTYFKLRSGATLAHIQADAQNFLQRYYGGMIGGVMKSMRLDLYPLSHVHLAPPGRWPMSPAMDPRTLWTMGLVGLLVIFIAVVNFVNIMTARAAQRAIEVGIRKSAGARRRDLVVQFLGESAIYVFAAVLVAMALVELALPAFNELLGSGDEIHQPATVTFPYWREPLLAGALFLSASVVSLLAGAYPAFVMSSTRPANALRRGVSGIAAARVRNGLVAVQLAILIGLVFAVTVIHRQMKFATNEALRIDHEQVVLLFFAESYASKAFREALARIPGVSGVTAAVAAPTNFDINATHFSHAGGERVFLQISTVDLNFFEFFHLQPLAGRLPSPDRSTDLFGKDDPNRDAAVWLNESAARALGFTSPPAAVGEKLTLFGGMGPGRVSPATLTVAGIISDFPVDSIRGPIQPAVYIVDPDAARIVSIRLRAERIPEALAAIDDLWRKRGEPRAVARLFLDAYHQRLYVDIIQQQRVLGALCGVAIFLSVLGLFGLSIYTAQRRTKEIGIRKVMGASTGDVMRLLLWAFSKPVLSGSLLAWPVAAWLMTRWLEGFAYRVSLGWWSLPAASLLALTITLLTVTVHSLIAARAKPVTSLRYE
jgi:putative ABC transport system permease protein